MALRKLSKLFKRKPAAKPEPRKPYREWKKAKDVERLSVSQQKIGEGGFGKVFLGRIKFKGKKPKITRKGLGFKQPLSFQQAKECFELTARLMNAGYPFFLDFIEKSAKGIHPLDLDNLVLHKPGFDRDVTGNVRFAVRNLYGLVMELFEKSSRKRLFGLFLETLKPEYRKTANEEIKRVTKRFAT